VRNNDKEVSWWWKDISVVCGEDQQKTGSMAKYYGKYV